MLDPVLQQVIEELSEAAAMAKDRALGFSAVYERKYSLTQEEFAFICELITSDYMQAARGLREVAAWLQMQETPSDPSLTEVIARTAETLKLLIEALDATAAFLKRESDIPSRELILESESMLAAMTNMFGEVANLERAEILHNLADHINQSAQALTNAVLASKRITTTQ